jgi:Mrp family chromosome partitioning ATPase
VFLREQFDDTVRRSTDLSDNLDVPYLGPLPIIRDRDLSGLPAHLQVRGLKRAARRELKLLTAAAAAPLSMLTESMRRALFELKRMDRGEDAGPHLVAITSMLSGEGKSFFASNFAFFLAQQGLRVVLADGDIRKSHLSEVFGQAFGESTDCHQPFIALAPNLLFAPAPEDARHSIEDHLRDMLRRSGPIDPPVDVIVLDTSPVAYVADALLISSRIDSAILVVKSGVTAVSTLQRFLDMNQPIANKIIGTCLSQSGSLRTRPYEFIPSSSGYYWPPPGRASRRKGRSWKRKANGA